MQSKGLNINGLVTYTQYRNIRFQSSFNLFVIIEWGNLTIEKVVVQEFLEEVMVECEK